MGRDSKVGWTDDTFNPWIGCSQVSPACENCYAMTSTPVRVSRAAGLMLWGTPNMGAVRRVTSADSWAHVRSWQNKAASSRTFRRVFCASLADVFEDWNGSVVEHGFKSGVVAPSRLGGTLYEVRMHLFRLIEQTPNLVWLVLTKRPENVRRMVQHMGWLNNGGAEWPRNLWIGCTVENEKYAELRMRHLLEIPAAGRFVSYEPAIEEVNFAPYLATGRLDWGITGGESDPHGVRDNCRIFDMTIARRTMRQFMAAGVPLFVKQLGSNPVDGCAPYPVTDRAGADMAEWPEDLRVQQLPTWIRS
jgi:protein gp37